MKPGLKEEECLVFPAVPTIPRGEALALKRFISYFDENTAETIYASAKKGKLEYQKPIGIISSKGTEVFSCISRVLDGSSPDELESAEKILSQGLEQLKAFEPKDALFAGAYNLDGEVDLPAMGGIIGGTAPIKGKLIETAPSAYGILEYSGEDKEKYVDLLLKTIEDVAIPLKKTLPAERDETFVRWLRPIVEKDTIYATHIIKTNRYLENTKEYCQNAAKLSRVFGSLELTGMHLLSENEKKEKLKDAGLKMLSPLGEKLSNTGLSVGIAITSCMAGAGASVYALKTIPEPTNNYVGFAILGATIIPATLLLQIGLRNYYIMRNDKNTLIKLKTYLAD